MAIYRVYFVVFQIDSAVDVRGEVALFLQALSGARSVVRQWQALHAVPWRRRRCGNAHRGVSLLLDLKLVPL